MIRFIAIIIIFFAVLAFSPLLIDEKGYILIAMGETIIELTILSAIIMFTLFSISAFILFKALRGSLNISFKAWNTLAFASRRRGIANFNKGLAAYMLEDYQGAEQLFAKSAEPAKRQQSAYLLAAAASAKQQLDSNTNHYLDLLEQETAKSTVADLASVIVKIKLLMNQDSSDAYVKARRLIDENHKEIGHDARLLVLEVDLCLIEKRFESAVDYLSIVRKEKSISDETLQVWEAKAYYGVFNHIITKQDQTSLLAYWKSVGRKVKQRETVLFAYFQVLAEHNINDPLIKLITPLLKKEPNARLLKHLRSLPIKHSEPLITLVQKHLHNNSKNPLWLSYLGHLAIMGEQWSMAEKAFGSLIKLEGQQYDKQDLHALAKALTEEGQHQAANEVWIKVHNLYQEKNSFKGC
jgi:HemY protein